MLDGLTVEVQPDKLIPEDGMKRVNPGDHRDFRIAAAKDGELLEPLPDLPRACSFCGKDGAQVKKLFSNPPGRGQRAMICDECVWVCQAILRDG